MTASAPRWLILWAAASLSVIAVAALQGAPDDALPPPSVPDAAGRPAETSPASASLPSLLGGQSCATSACHGGLTPSSTPDQLRFDEFQVWLRDPHAGASRALDNARSRRIFQRLGFLDEQGGIIAGRRADYAQQRQSCLACHGDAESSATSEKSKFLASGVSCESCHGAAEHWIELHASAPGPLRGDRSQWAALGFRDVVTPSVKAAVCVDCHVGGPGREVNHDLIAAGHPALKFELTSFLSRLPAHWKPGRRAVVRHESPRLRDWLAGQFAQAEAALAQRQRRAAAAGQGGVWPELSELNCFACHHELAADPGRRADVGRAVFDNQTGRLLIPAEQWNLAVLRQAASRGNDSSTRAVADALEKLDTAMQPFPPNAEAVVEASQQARDALDLWRRSLGDSESAPDTLQVAWMQHLLDDSSARAALYWDALAQLSLALAARSEGADTVPSEVVELWRVLRFPKEQGRVWDSPRSPASLAPSSTEQRERALLDALRTLTPPAR